MQSKRIILVLALVLVVLSFMTMYTVFIYANATPVSNSPNQESGKVSLFVKQYKPVSTNGRVSLTVLENNESNSTS